MGFGDSKRVGVPFGVVPFGVVALLDLFSSKCGEDFDLFAERQVHELFKFGGELR